MRLGIFIVIVIMFVITNSCFIANKPNHPVLFIIIIIIIVIVLIIVTVSIISSSMSRSVLYLPCCVFGKITRIMLSSGCLIGFPRLQRCYSACI